MRRRVDSSAKKKMWALPDRPLRRGRVRGPGRAGTGGAELCFRSGLAEAAAEQLEDRRRDRPCRGAWHRHGLGIQPAERLDQSRARKGDRDV